MSRIQLQYLFSFWHLHSNSRATLCGCRNCVLIISYVLHMYVLLIVAPTKLGFSFWTCLSLVVTLTVSNGTVRTLKRVSTDTLFQYDTHKTKIVSPPTMVSIVCKSYVFRPYVFRPSTYPCGVVARVTVAPASPVIAVPRPLELSNICILHVTHQSLTLAKNQI